MDITGWQAQLRKGAAELAVLAALRRGELYGLQILGLVSEVVSEGALYPLLNRLERDGKLIARWSLDAGSAHPRKYYTLSPDGAAIAAEMIRHWGEFKGAVAQIVEDSA